MNKFKKYQKEIWSITKYVIAALAISFIVLSLSKLVTLNTQKKELGIQAVQKMYQFTDLQQLKLNMIDLKAITTEPVFNQLTVDNEDRALYTYLKFKGDVTNVNVIKATSSYVLYSIDNQNITDSRRFIFMFDCDSSGKISYAREAEIYDFVSYAD